MTNPVEQRDKQIKEMAVEIQRACILTEAKVYYLANRLTNAGYLKPPELTVLTEEQIKEKLGKIQPEGFDWVTMTNTEMIKFKAIAVEQLDHTKKELKGEQNECL